jgi:uncharacterized protein (DUF4415 family)
MRKSSAAAKQKRVVDPQNPPLTIAQLSRMRKARDAVPHIVAAYHRMRGRPPAGDLPKISVSLRVDREVVDAFKATGKGWQTRMHDALAKAAAKLKAAPSRSATR